MQRCCDAQSMNAVRVRWKGVEAAQRARDIDGLIRINGERGGQRGYRRLCERRVRDRAPLAKPGDDWQIVKWRGMAALNLTAQVLDVLKEIDAIGLTHRVPIGLEIL